MYRRQIRLWHSLVLSVSPDRATAELSEVHPRHCLPARPLHSHTSSCFTSSTRANLSSCSWQTTHLCVNGSSEERGEVKEGRQVWAGGEQREGRAEGNMVARRTWIVHSARLFKGHILFEGPHPILHSTSVSLSPPPPPAYHALSANPLGSWTVHCLGLFYYSPYTAGVIWKTIKELKDWIENVALQRFALPHKTAALYPKKRAHRWQAASLPPLPCETIFKNASFFFL